jgi:Fe-S-cluster-containing hydrogenase component 2
MSLKVIASRCPQNHACPAVRICPTGALAQRGMAAPSVEQAKCTNCGKCVRYCPTGALALDRT